MSYSSVLDDDLTVAKPISKRGMSRITMGFNAALLTFHAVAGFLTFLVSDRARDFPLSGIVLSSSIDLVRFVVMMLCSAAFIQAFWQRLITSLAPIRTINFQEALAIALMASLLLGH